MIRKIEEDGWYLVAVKVVIISINTLSRLGG
jgi:hypothetical protein